MASNPSVNFSNVKPDSQVVMIDYNSDSTSLEVLNPIDDITYNWYSSARREVVATGTRISETMFLNDDSYSCTPKGTGFSYFQYVKKVAFPLKGTREATILDTLPDSLKVVHDSGYTKLLVDPSHLIPEQAIIKWFWVTETSQSSKIETYHSVKIDTIKESSSPVLSTEELIPYINNNINYDTTYNDPSPYASKVDVYIKCEVVIEENSFIWDMNRFDISNWMKVEETSTSPMNKQRINDAYISNQNLKITALHSENAEIVITNLMGQVISRKSVALNAGLNTVELTDNIAPGVYIAQLKQTQSIRKFKFSK